MTTRITLISTLVVCLAFGAASGADLGEQLRNQALNVDWHVRRCRIVGPVVGSGREFTATVETIDGASRKPFTAWCPEKYAKILRPGDKCLVRPESGRFVIVEPLREGRLLVLLGVLAAGIAVTMGWRGVRVLGSVALAIALMLCVLVPLSVRGWPPLPLAALLSVGLCAAGMVLIGGWNRKSLCAIGGALCALAAAVWLPLALCRILVFTGLEAEFGTLFHPDVPLWYSPVLAGVDFQQVLLAGMLIASLGATMDVAMVVATAVWEVKQAAPTAGAGRLWKTGLGVGRDVVGIMAVAVILLYAGSQFQMLLLYHLRGLPDSPGLLLNYEEIAVEVVYMVCTCLALALAVPATAAIAARWWGTTNEPKNA
ncbi:MAG TPA: YibE/F family protein [Planctomycetota bacterium]|nr:YibE/F family protein [Planctomycetota bacterium]